MSKDTEIDGSIENAGDFSNRRDKGAGKIGPFTFLDEEEGHKLTSDPVLLSDFIGPLSEGDNLLDIGTGAGQILLLLAVNNPGARLTGVEVRERAIKLAEDNIKANGLSDSVTLIHSDYRRLKELLKKESFSVISSNPPYIKKNHGRTSPSEERAAARSEVYGTLGDLLDVADYLMSPDGRLSLIFPVKRFSELLVGLEKRGLKAVRLCFIHSRVGKNARLFLVEARRHGELTVEEPVFL